MPGHADYTDNDTPINNKQIAITYAKHVIRGVIPACEYVKLAAKRFLYDLVNPHYYYSHSEVDTVITFLNTLTLSEENKGDPFLLEPWQTFIIVNLYGLLRKRDSLRKYRYFYQEVARGNGKSQVVTGLALYHLIIDQDAQCIISANSREQAKTIDFEKVKNYAKQLDPEKKHIKHYYNFLRYGTNQLLVTPSKPENLDGLSVSMGVIEELHEAPSGKMYDVLKSSMSKRKQPLLLTVTTAGFNTDSYCYGLRTYCTDVLNSVIDDPAQFAIIYTTDEDEDINDINTVIKANPNLNVSVDYEGIKSEVLKALHNESEKPGVLVKHFNRWLKHNTEDIWIPESYIVKSFRNMSIYDQKYKEIEDLEVWVGIDLSSVSDLTAVSYMINIENKFYFINDLYIPEDSINSTVNKDMYRDAAQHGHINITQGNVVDYDRILTDILKVAEKYFIKQISYDKYNATQFAINATEAGLFLIPFSQTPGSLNQPLKEFERLIKQDQIIIQKNPLTKWMLGNVVLKQDKNGNYSIDKSSRNKKIDGVAAMITAMGGWLEFYKKFT